MPTSLFLIMCLAIAPHGACQAEVQQGDWQLYIAMVPEYPIWATTWCVNKIAHIVASETMGINSAKLACACTIKNDIEDGYSCYSITPGRWKGYGVPNELDRMAVYAALTGGCDDVPRFRYFGNWNDLQYFMRMGWVKEQPVYLYIGDRGAMVVGIP